MPTTKRHRPATVISTPFSASPDPSGVFLTVPFKSAIFKTTHAIDRRQGLSAILGDPGHGKSTLLRYLYGSYSAKPGYVCSFSPSPNFKSDYSMLRKIGQDFGIDPRRSMYEQQNAFEAWVSGQYAAGINIVIFIDEAQRLFTEQLELIRTMLNYETNIDKTIQIVMAGNLDLRDRLLQKKNRALLSRVFAPSMMSAMAREEMDGMLHIRCERESIRWPFMDEALSLVYEWSRGIPRAILQACEFAYLKAGQHAPITGEIMAEVLDGLEIHEEQEKWRSRSRG